MSDRSFGDYTNRNVVKNPLLSTAVTGLSIEDLTHNAVLIPVSLSQEVITRPDIQFGAQTRSLGDFHDLSNLPSGDANSNTTPTNQPTTSNPPQQNTRPHPKSSQNPQQNNELTQSKASAKSDDFDVNEYFARLHGTRYVSAPINSNLKDDNNANLEAREDNLEEINLNEPDKNEPQGLTADIAQNFSQLPTVLPQVASAVFSSFSNMLNLKSREQTPDEVKYQDAQFERPAAMPVEDFGVKEVVPPPKEPPVVGTSNYRLPTKKKYAQIPGLTSNTQPSNQMTSNLPPSNPTTQTHDIKGLYPSDPGASTSNQSDEFRSNDKQYNIFNPLPTELDKIQESRPNEKQYNIFNPLPTELDKKQELRPNEKQYNIFNPLPTELDKSLFAPPNTPAQGSNSSLKTLSSQSSTIAPEQSATFSTTSIPLQENSESQILRQESILPPQNVTSTHQPHKPPLPPLESSTMPNIGPPGAFTSQAPAGSITGSTVIPPPPMFSNQARKDSQQTVGKTVLPPSVARRINSNHPFMKPQAPPSVFTENIFVPTVDATSGSADSSVVQPPSAFAPYVSSQSPTNVSQQPDTSRFTSIQNTVAETIAPPPMFNPACIATPFGIPASGQATSFQVTTTTTTVALSSSVPSPGLQAIPQSMQTGVSLSASIPASNADALTPPPMISPSPASVRTPISSVYTSETSVPASQNPPLVFSSSDANQFFNASAITSSEVPHAHTSVTEPPKPLMEPPKQSENVNYRMTKKRPQYYSGPIQGVGAISNNVKPIIQPVENSSFQGNLFAPSQSALDSIPNVEQSQPFDLSRPIEAASTPFNINQQPNLNQPDMNTAFDLSRPTAEKFEPPQQESRGFGIIGSLKSKLSSIDINKIQSSVTTFFDPAYNNAQKESDSAQQNLHYDQPYSYGNQSSNFEIFVPNVVQDQPIQSQGYQNVDPYHQNQNQYYQNHQNQSMSYFESTPQLSNPPSFAPASQFPSHGNLKSSYQQDMYAQSQFPQQTITAKPPSISYENIEKSKQEQGHFTNQFHPVETTGENTNIQPLTFPAQASSTAIYKPDNVENFEDNSDKPQNISSVINSSQDKCTVETKLPSTHKIEPEPTKIEKTFPSDVLKQSSADSFFDMPHSKSEDKSVKQPPEWPQSKPENISIIQPTETIDNQTNMLAQQIALASDILSAEETRSSGLRLPEHKPKNKEALESQLTESSNKKLIDQGNVLLSDPRDFFSTFDHRSQSTPQGVLTFDMQSNFSEIQKDQGDVPLELSMDLNPDLTMASAPLFGLSTMLANKTKELTDLENDMKNLELLGTPKEIDSIFNRDSNASFFENIKKTDVPEIKKDDIPDLNICETCREVNRPEENYEETDDLTTQLIENIVAPIQLSNPVEVPLTESNTPTEDLNDFDSKQCEEISLITEDTIETLQVQSATELLDDQVNNLNTRAYGWTIEERTIEEHSHDYNMPNPQVAVGFVGDNSLFTNASDEIKAEFYSHEESPVVLPRQMSTPTAPTEEDIKSDEAGLDVHSIEQDAKKDFPIFEEFVIEPSETDDDKIECKERKSSEDIQEVDSFTSRVEKFKKMEGLDQGKIFDLTSTTSPSLPIASYFDTGNYAAEAHYQSLYNSITSSAEQIRVPPGFEEEYRKKLMKIIDPNSPDFYKDLTQIPDTSTQTRPVYSPTFSVSPIMQNITASSVTSRMSDSVQESIAPTVTPQIAQNPVSLFNTTKFGNFQAKEENTTKIDHQIPEFPVMDTIRDLLSPCTPISDTTVKSIETAVTTAPEIKNKDQLFSGFPPENQSTLKSNETAVMKTPENQNTDQLFSVFPTENQPSKPIETKPLAQIIPQRSQVPDPINFFSETTENSDDNIGFNRLASYFASPAKTDHSKSFFELSQGQDHFRQQTKDSINIPNSSKDSFINQNMDSEPNPFNISQESYEANLNLMKELTSPQNIEIPSDLLKKTTNYFTVEYDNSLLKSNTEFTKNKIINKDEITVDNDQAEETDNEVNDVIMKCKYCCDLKYGYVERYYNVFHEHVITRPIKVKTCMNSDSANKKKEMESSTVTDSKSKSVTMADSFSIEEESSDGVYVGSDKENRSLIEYSPVRHHWFYRIDIEGKSTWRGFSEADSKALESAFNSPDLNENTIVPTDGGRYDVNVMGRIRIAVYWADKPANVRRCSWFYKGTTDARYVPYTESVAEKLEEEYRRGMTTGEWHRRLVLPNNELVVMHGPAVMVHFLQSSTADAFSGPSVFAFGKRVYRNPPKISVARDLPQLVDHLLLLVHGAGEYRHQKEKTQSMMRPRVVRRGHDESEIEDIEPSSIDHLLLFCHGVGSACDMRFRSVEEVVDDFRSTSLQLIQAHYKSSCENGSVGRVEVLPISWHTTLHSGETGVDRRLDRITLKSIPRLRAFTNDTVLDVLFYTSPVYCQTIVNTVCNELNRVYQLFCSRNPDFHGGISLGGHSLGSVILYDLLCHQSPTSPIRKSPLEEKSFINGAITSGLPNVAYPKLDFAPVALYALGSPIAIFECIRGVEMLGTNFKLPTCRNFFNIFHPYDPIAYRIEPLISQELENVKPFLIPHHKGRKRMHLELKETMARVGADIKQKLIESVKTTWTNMWKSQPPSDKQLEKVVEEEIEKEKEQLTENKEEQQNDIIVNPELLGKLNDGRRIDYVLQEAPFEMINEYLFAMSSHVCYWESEDTMLLILRQIYDSLGVQPDSTIPQQNLTVQRTRVVRIGEEVLTESPSTSRGAS